MNSYFYHGIEFYPGIVGNAMKLMFKILDEGLILRSQVRGLTDSNMNHICLYRKNYDYDYSDDSSLIHSARGGWIDSQFVFIINPDIDAKKVELGSETDLVDEWRSFENILPTNFVGIALPFDSIQEYLNEKNNIDEEDKIMVKNYLTLLINKAKSMGLIIVNSNQKSFTDELDKNLTNKVIK